ncbi:MAG TPA: hypothetical protein VHC70_04860, partial [Phycisphaerales bacterium]|nr:hypothetical protein [Phycisphaerales bacterium]
MHSDDSSAPPMPAHPPVAPGHFYAREHPCVRCGYNLQTMELDERCPECGTPGVESLGSLSAARPEDVRRVGRGVRAMAWSAIVFPLVAAGLIYVDIR